MTTLCLQDYTPMPRHHPITIDTIEEYIRRESERVAESPTLLVEAWRAVLTDDVLPGWYVKQCGTGVTRATLEAAADRAMYCALRAALHDDPVFRQEAYKAAGVFAREYVTYGADHDAAEAWLRRLDEDMMPEPAEDY